MGNPVGYTTRAGQIRTSVFDSRNRETQTRWSDDTPNIARSFDAAGRVVSEDNGAVALTYSYNAANQVLNETTQVTGQPARKVGYAYDAAGRLASTTYPGGNVVAQSYTPRGQIAGIGLDGGTVASYESLIQRLKKVVLRGKADAQWWRKQNRHRLRRTKRSIQFQPAF